MNRFDWRTALWVVGGALLTLLLVLSFAKDLVAQLHAILG
ncbi:Uncharacterised protein [Mycobacteroides abscessus subsp. abscessus]|uniref:Uncharacterized protein n=1 Tax=Dermabacter vaginalis TaxID=1630135 RepID=A0A1B0ZHQ9_9MICO|nr:hypothetical protein DAD186_09850 [Dermabacter vaginalis]SHV77190.1 Uncharacterised protein [Mycobacteroides abscessus subsp. abscessus]